MRIERVNVSGCRSIEAAELEKLSQFNVLVGRNNAGKSSFFHAIHYVAERLHGRTPEWARSIRNSNLENVLTVDFSFRVADEERLTFFRSMLFWQTPPSDGTLNRLMQSPLARQVVVSFSTVKGYPTVMHLKRTSLLAGDGNLATIQRITGDESTANPKTSYVKFGSLEGGKGPFGVEAIESAPQGDAHPQIGEWVPSVMGPEAAYFQLKACAYIKGIFFFHPSRRSGDRMGVQGNVFLVGDGANLPQVLSSIRNNNEEQYAAIVQFIEGALPDIGKLHTTLDGTQTQIGFRRKGLPTPIPLLDMGTGVQQLLMIAVLLETTSEETAIAIEEPESNLHPGAQRYLLDRLTRNNRQVFVATHSPVFANVTGRSSIYRIVSEKGTSTAIRVKQRSALNTVLEEIGVRNSDVLLSDAVLFVEGPSDIAVLDAWAAILGKPFAERGITTLTLSGGSAPGQAISQRLELLSEIKNASPIPYRFMLDRDERTDKEINDLSEMLKESLVLLDRRELENYLLAPRAVVGVLNEILLAKHGSGAMQLAQTQIQKRIAALAMKFKSLVLAKRIRAACGRMVGGPFPRDLIDEICTLPEKTFAEELEKRLRDRFDNWLSSAQVAGVVTDEKMRVDLIFDDVTQTLSSSPGADILEALFQEFEVVFDKKSHGRRIASNMRPEEIPAVLMPLFDWSPHLT